MVSNKMRTVLLLMTVSFICNSYGLSDLPAPLSGTETYQLRMPGANPAVDDAYLCTAYKLDPEKEMYITQFRVEGTAERAHHMILNGCGDIPVAAEQPYWNCGHHGTCSGSSSILYAWAKNAAGTRLPPSVGFRIGSGHKSRVKYLVVQVHYAKKLEPHELDYTGLDLEITTQPQRYIAGILLMIGSPEIPPFQAVVNSDACCPFDMPAPIHIFAARVHAHGLGKVISVYKFDPKTKETELIIKGNPQWPQAFYPTTREFHLKHGDEILGRCTYASLGKSTYTYSGGTGADEMCNIYLMYYTDANNGTGYRSCGYLCNEDQNRAYPADSVEPLPPNPILESYAIHGKNHLKLTGGIVNNDDDHPEIITQKMKTAAGEDAANVAGPLLQDPMTLNRVYYKEVFSDAAHKEHQGHKESGENKANQEEKGEEIEGKQSAATTPETRSQDVNAQSPPSPPPPQQSKDAAKQKESNFWSFLFFYRRFFSS